ncbi:MAG TPA: hypothetical protein PKC49_13110 [Phycisphaerae bacterium]|nr:hypothetical protein [Phycisphaerae bacterium]
MSLPAYKRPFEADDFRGYFTWSQALTEKLGDSLFHACHEAEAKNFLSEGTIGVRSTWRLVLPGGKQWECPGTWCGLNYFHNGNRYGPILFEIPLEIMSGRTFMVFRRTDDRHRYFFVQYEAQIPIFEFKGELWRKVNPAKYFDEATFGKGLSMKPGAIYDIVITTPLALSGASVRGVAHPKCVPEKCSGWPLEKSRAAVRAMGLRELHQALFQGDVYRQLAERFPDIIGLEITLPELPEG